MKTQNPDASSLAWLHVPKPQGICSIVHRIWGHAHLWGLRSIHGTCFGLFGAPKHGGSDQPYEDYGTRFLTWPQYQIPRNHDGKYLGLGTTRAPAA